MFTNSSNQLIQFMPNRHDWKLSDSVTQQWDFLELVYASKNYKLRIVSSALHDTAGYLCSHFFQVYHYVHLKRL